MVADRHGMMGVTFFCHVRRDIWVRHAMLQNALQWLHVSCMEFALERKPGRDTLFFLVKWLQAAMRGISYVRRLRAAFFGEETLFSRVKWQLNICNTSTSVFCS